MGPAMQNVSSGIYGQRRHRSAQSDQDLHCRLVESLGSVEHKKMYSKISDQAMCLR